MIECQDLTKNFKIYSKAPGLSGALKSFFNRTYRTNTAVDHFSFDIKEGEFIGLLGPNGAGKTTLIKMMTGIIVPSSGKLLVNGYEPQHRNVKFRKHIALVMGQKSQLWWDIPAMDSFLLLQRYYEVSETQFKDRLAHLSELLNVKKLMEVHVRKLSLGERMKLELMASLLHSPKVIFLDEPTIGLDLVAQEKIREFLQDYHQQFNPTIILTSHYMADVAALCERIVMILDGCKRFDGSIGEFENLLGREKSVKFNFEQKVDNVNSEFWNGLHGEWNPEQNQVEVRIPISELRQVSTKILQEYPVVDFSSDKMPIERVMKSLLENPNLLEKNS